MADSTVQIKLVTTADTSGAQKAADAMDKVEAGIKEVGQESKEAELTIRQLEAELRKTREALRDLTPSDARLPQMRQEIGRLEQSLGKAGVGGRNAGNALYLFAQGAEDAQYGLRGIQNNIPGFLQAMGASTRVMGVASLAAVAIGKLGPKLLAFFKTLDTEGAYLDKLRKQLGDVSAALREGFNPSQQAAQEASAAFTEQIKDEMQAVEDEKKAIDAVIASLRLRNQIQDTADEFALRNQVEGIRASDLGAPEKMQQEASARLQFEAAKKTRADQLANDEAAAAQVKINKDRELAAVREQQARQAEQDLAQSKLVAKFLDPKNEGSITALQKKIKEKSYYESGAGLDLKAVLQSEIKTLSDTLSQRMKIVEDFASKTAGGSISLTDPAAVTGFQKTLADRAAGLRGESSSLNAQASREQAVFDAAGGDRAMQQSLRDLQLTQKQRELSTGAGAQPASAPLFQPAAPFGPAPLPRLAPGLPGVQPPNPFGLPQPLPSGGNFNAQPASPFGPAPLPSAPPVNTKPIEQAAVKNDEANAAVMKFAEATVKQNEVLVRKMNLLEERMKNSRVT